MMPIRTILAISLAAALSLAMPTQSLFAMGGGGRDHSNNSPAAREGDYDMGVKAAKSGKYEDAIESLHKAVDKDPRNADAWNYLGYSQRKAGQLDAALTSYNNALQIDPTNKGAHEYLGELYLMTDNLPKAEELLKTLAQLCTSCEERRSLEEAVTAYKKAKGII